MWVTERYAQHFSHLCVINIYEFFLQQEAFFAAVPSHISIQVCMALK
jgi:hypothetical protein